jgi:hypothetical protein
MKFRSFFFGVIIIFLTSCNNQLPDVTSIDIPKDEINSKIILDAPAGWNSFEVGDSIALGIVNTSNEQIIFDPSYGTRIFVYENNTWTETSNKLVRLNDKDIILEPTKTGPDASGYTAVLPNLLDESKNITMRIYVLGYVYRNNTKTDEKTGAFIDIVLRR